MRLASDARTKKGYATVQRVTKLTNHWQTIDQAVFQESLSITETEIRRAVACLRLVSGSFDRSTNLWLDVVSGLYRSTSVPNFSVQS